MRPPVQQCRRPLAHRTGAAQHHRTLAAKRTAVRQPGHGRGGRGIGAVAVEHDRNPEFTEEFLLHRGEQRLALGHVAAADEDRGVFLVLRASG